MAPQNQPSFLLYFFLPQDILYGKAKKGTVMDEHYPIFLPSQHFMDKAIKWLLSLPHHFQELLEFLSPELAEKLDFSTLKKLDPSLISPELRESVRDAFFRISTKKTSDGPKELVIHVLMEHQSRPISK
ncbi:MAG: hypothetical protein D6785_06660, partial [Planctomycetota bacterium]